MFYVSWALYDTAIEFKFKTVGHIICAYSHKSEQKVGPLKLSSIGTFCFYDIIMHECLWKRACSWMGVLLLIIY